MAGLPSIQQVFADPNFRQLAGPEKIKVMERLDPNFAGLPLAEKSKVVMRLLQPGGNPQDPGFLPTLGRDIASIPGQLMHPIDTVSAGMAATRRELDATGDAYKQGRYWETVGHGLAAALPIVGPAAAQAGEELGGGQPGAGAAHAAELLAPSGMKAAYRALPAPVRGAVGEAASTAKAATGGAIRGGYQGATEMIPAHSTLGKMGLKLPRSVAQGALGAYAGKEIAGPVGAKVGAVVGAGYPVVKGAIQGAREALGKTSPERAAAIEENALPKPAGATEDVYQSQYPKDETLRRAAVVKDANLGRFLKSQGMTKTLFDELGEDPVKWRTLLKSASQQFGTDYRFTKNFRARLAEIRKSLPD